MSTVLIGLLNLILGVFLLFLIYFTLDRGVFDGGDHIIWTLVKSLLMINVVMIFILSAYPYFNSPQNFHSGKTEDLIIHKLMTYSVPRNKNLYHRLVEDRIRADSELGNLSTFEKSRIKPFPGGWLVGLSFVSDGLRPTEYVFFTPEGESLKPYCANQTSKNALPELPFKEGVTDRQIFDTLNEIKRNFEPTSFENIDTSSSF